MAADASPSHGLSSSSHEPDIGRPADAWRPRRGDFFPAAFLSELQEDLEDPIATRSQRRAAGALKRRRVPLPWPEDRDFRILSIDGGGIRGIFPAAVLAGLEERYLRGSSIGAYFDLIAGTSTGGIISLGLGLGLPASRLRDLYSHRGREIFPPTNAVARQARRVRSFFRYRYDRGALTTALDDTFGKTKLAEARTRLCVPSADGRHGDLYVFKTPHHPDFQLDGRELMTKIAAATSAAPTYYRPLDAGGFTFVDGGLWANNPVMVGLIDALSCFSVPRHRVRILSIGCGSVPYTIGKWQKWLGGLWHWRKVTDAIMHFQSLCALGQAGLLLGADRVDRIDAPRTAKPIELDDWVRAHIEFPPAASTVLDRCGDRIASTFLEVPAQRYSPVHTTDGPITDHKGGPLS